MIVPAEPKRVLQPPSCAVLQEGGVQNNSCLLFHMQNQQFLFLNLVHVANGYGLTHTAFY